ncbi:hypothetical protein [Calothrix sp. 336/3]|uniref:hypothetical protein n=1 Tax=Calothrix sp. 336/3 TaxID=1337936 RepID=UPI0004E3F7BC|nr:hypothetical protein [Calothrix sp. 336/3]AKG21705.1 phytanoyl-CoA dioxygenase (PhyH) [Calothrix sp. 336/3]
MNSLVKQVRNKILQNIYEIPFWQSQLDLDYYAAKENHASCLPSISDFDLGIVEAVKKEGVAITSLEALAIPSTEKMWQASAKVMSGIPVGSSEDKNEYVVHASPEQMIKFPEIFLWGLQERLLNIVEHYIGLPVAYHGAYFRRDLANQIERKSRLWHIDGEDRKLLKIIVYLHDVDENCGPFQYIPQSLTTEVMASLRYRHGYIQDSTMQKVVSPSMQKSCTGVAGTVVFASTSDIFHRGKIPVTQDRFTIFYDYTCRQPRYPFYCKSSLPEAELQLLASHFSEEQKQCVFWRQES